MRVVKGGVQETAGTDISYIVCIVQLMVPSENKKKPMPLSFRVTPTSCYNAL